MAGPFFGRLFVNKQTYLSRRMPKLGQCIFCRFVNKTQKGNFIMPIVVFTVALVLGISSPEYQEFRKHSNGNDAYSISFVDPCDTGLRDTGTVLGEADLNHCN